MVTQNIINSIQKSSRIRLFYNEAEFYEPLIGIEGLRILCSNCRYSHKIGTLNISGIYQIRNLITNGIYIGRFSSGHRFKDYLLLGDGVETAKVFGEIKESIKKYGMDHHITQILEIVKDHDLLHQKENDWMELKNKTENLMNCLDMSQNTIPILTNQETDRFKSKITIANRIKYWTGRLQHGYGIFDLQGKGYKAHRIAYVLNQRKLNQNYQIPNNLIVRHINTSRDCVDPKYLTLGTDRDNAQDRKTKKQLNFVNKERKLYLKWAQENPFSRGYIKQRAKKLGYKYSTFNQILNNSLYHNHNYCPPYSCIGIRCHKRNSPPKRYEAYIPGLKYEGIKKEQHLGYCDNLIDAMSIVDDHILQLRPYGFNCRTNKERKLY